jgi:hypothetical protein
VRARFWPGSTSCYHSDLGDRKKKKVEWSIE